MYRIGFPDKNRSLDPLLGVFTGVFAFYLHQTNPRTAPPPGESLKELIEWKRAKSMESRSKSLGARKEPELEATIENLLEEAKSTEHTH